MDAEGKWIKEAQEHNEGLLVEWEGQPKEKSELEIVKETVDMLVVTMLGGGLDV